MDLSHINDFEELARLATDGLVIAAKAFRALTDDLRKFDNVDADDLAAVTAALGEGLSIGAIAISLRALELLPDETQDADAA
jgi:hypothetical protein